MRSVMKYVVTTTRCDDSPSANRVPDHPSSVIVLKTVSKEANILLKPVNPRSGLPTSTQLSPLLQAGPLSQRSQKRILELSTSIVLAVAALSK
jgi:hypothetical protein